MRYKLYEDAVLQGVWHVEAVDADQPWRDVNSFHGPNAEQPHARTYLGRQRRMQRAKLSPLVGDHSRDPQARPDRDRVNRAYMQSRADTARAAIWVILVFALVAVVVISFDLGSPLPAVIALLVVGAVVVLARRRKGMRRPADLD